MLEELHRDLFIWHSRGLELRIESSDPMKPVNDIQDFASDFGFAGYFLFYWRFN
ncbi:MAG: hypothetical protein QOH78_1389 [Verrucomicrobiota bacterium]|jgi:hypothetical protein